MRIQIIGQKKSGKTTYCEALTRYLIENGQTVWYRKHSSMYHSAADLETDTGKLRQAGADLSLFETSERVEIVSPSTASWLKEFQIRQELSHDITLIEGHRSLKGAKVEVIAPGGLEASYFRSGEVKGIVALVTDEDFPCDITCIKRRDFDKLIRLARHHWSHSTQRKQQLRRHVTFLKAGRTVHDLELKSHHICGLIEPEPVYQRAATVLLYWPMPGEVDLRPLLDRHTEKKFYLPVVEGDGQLSFGLYQGRETLTVNKMGIWEPVHAPRIDGQAIDLVLTPGMAFTNTGSRLGRGGGFYDRLLAKRTPAQTFWGVSFDFQIFTDLPMSEYDRPVDRVFSG